MNVTDRRQKNLRTMIQAPFAGPLMTLIVVYVLFSIFVPHFFTLRSATGIINAAMLTGVLTIGVTMLMIAGEFDLSVGAMMAMGGYLYGRYSVEGGNPLLAVLLALAIPGLMGAINGLIRIRTDVPSFIVTLATRFIYRGVVWIYSGGFLFETIERAPVYQVFNGRMDFIADAVKGANFRTSLLWVLAMVMLFQYILTRTRFGNHVFAVGGNVEAAGSQGVDTKRVKVACFVISGIMAGMAGILLFSQFRQVRIATGSGEELKAIAAAVVGGTLLSGGYGSIIGALLGVLLISMLRTGVVLLNLPFIPADNFEAVVGVTIVAAAIFNHWIRQRA